MIWRILVLLLVVWLLFNIDDLGKKIYPFPYRETITHQAIAHNIDPFLLVALIKTESSFDPKATSPAGAMGLLQIMPDTGYWIAENTAMLNFTVEQLYQPKINIRMGAWYLADLNNQFNHELVLVLAAYNAGRGNVQKWLENGCWTGEQNTLDQIPFPETRNYIRKVMWHYQVYKFLYDQT
ncbi:lytic transglycosylase domain-containing protein [Peptococcaceae bacterium]|nr:lytic transglycosylase domain-containing protein [Peptococcaceae bacterium]